jgi:hypothetical protein
MGDLLRVFLISERNKTLFNIRSSDIPQEVKDRAEVIRLMEMMEHEAQEAEKLGRIRVIVQDNDPIYQCKEVKKLWSK